MRWTIPLFLMLAGAAAGGQQPQITVFGKVVSVPDATSLWVYIEDARASYHFCLSGVTPPPADQPEAQAARESLAKLVMGREVQVEVTSLGLAGQIPARVSIDGQSVNSLIAGVCPPAGPPGQPPVQLCDYQPPRRPLLTFCLRLLPTLCHSCALCEAQ